MRNTSPADEPRPLPTIEASSALSGLAQGRRMRIALINPITRLSDGYHTIGTFIPQLGLQVLAQLVPPGHEVELIDECFGADFTNANIRKDRYDLVAVTGYTSGATRAYEIAAMARKAGIPCIMGGPHASAVPDEAATHFDSVAIGECDLIWPGIVNDAAAGRMQKRYQGSLAELTAGIGRARQNLDPVNGKYDVSCIQTSRGCPVGCEYCSVTNFNGAPIRRRPMDDIIEEWNQTTKPFIFVVDDNFFGVGEKHAVWAKELMDRIGAKGNRRRLWFSQTTINMGDDADGLRKAYKCGCRGMFVGFETFNRENLREYHKGINRKNLDRYQELIDGFHGAGISLIGGFIAGGDGDDQYSVADTLTEAIRLGVDIIQITNLTPLPGTKMYERFMSEGRIFATNYPQDWERFTFTETVYNPRKMTAAELDEAICEMRYLAATKSWVWKRTWRTWRMTRSLTTTLFVHGMNKGWKRIASNQVPRDIAKFGPVKTDTPRWRRLLAALKVSRKTPRQIAEPTPA
ncbi:MAG: hypothetical protein BIFFINMI_03247 [Phycisphaerae bacterium]|nr:hypothetical protein [Phycisphaerae bacterium]